MTEFKLPFNARLTFTLLSLILLVYIAHTASSIIIPLLFAFLISIMLLPVTHFLEKRKFPRGLAAAVAVLLFIIVILLIMLLMGTQMQAFIADFPQLEKKLLDTVTSLQEWIDHKFHISSNAQLSYLQKAALGTLGTATSFISQTFLSLSSLIVFIVFVLLYSFFMLFYRKLLVTFLVRLFQEKHRDTLLDVLARTRYIIKSYVGGLMIEMVVVAVLNTAVFLILGIKYAILLGVMAAIFNIIPYIGIFTALIISMLVTLTTGTPISALQVGIALFLIHLLDSNVLLPRIVGSKVKINALVTIVGVVMGNMLWGIPGMFLAIPIIAIIKIVCESVDYMNPWAILLGDEQEEKTAKVNQIAEQKGQPGVDDIAESPSSPEKK
ncbi:AI-2E family transporter [Chitinophaga oryzae]|uniref:AI-2E family transporter n=1 Tax=Chitinophaga oryzae TaxID=2725414 RepID=A0AAE6ZD85_9BACT|nr:AI-2E family transporter [Chitinophaga oryzae]QJB30549.1 AI-2E family transporter [Chitinophaga oryzae]QJB37048.1 AI-2E family transporter [Chitinophaga oryzae]